MRRLPGPPHNYFLGHLMNMPPVLATQPSSNAAPQTYFHCLKEYYELPDVFYFDTWPLGPQLNTCFMKLGMPELTFFRFTIHNPDTGEDMIADDVMIWPVNVGVHRNPKYWPDPCKFDPDRFIQGSASYAASNKDAWIPFSKGNRNCIGQELAIIETKAILAMTIRTFDFQIAYDEVGKLKADGSGYPSLTDGILEQFGERAYQIQLGTAKPSEGLPCRVRLRK